ncbi:hypothetical protein BT63DRAFT_449874 [Microthyrium microscopicum]|uniref:Septin-type G domain-containing protein n=1 Tax=Microthyrium microscopicum TaxID=703497 RepID=A0A6A6UTS5_9PEZI|nr:hypothetical protein BT63DRAFT_449874 [Microthyrium microscopicum]
MSSSTPATDPSPNSPTSPSSNPRLDPNRRQSFGFLRRQKSTDGSQKHGMLSKKNKGLNHPPPQSIAPRLPPQLNPVPLSESSSFIGENARQAYAPKFGSSPGASSYTAVSPLHQSSSPPSYGVPMPPMSSYPTTSYSNHNNSEQAVDPYARTESMTHRGRYSYASSAISAPGINSPRRVRRRKDPTPFNILVVGAQNSGKTSFIDFLQVSLSAKGHQEKSTSPPGTAVSPDSPFTPHYLETEVDHERIGVTIWDSQGLEKKFVDLQLREMSSFLESKFEETFTEEQKVVRAPGVRDTHIHCVFLILDPARLDSNWAHTQKQSRSLTTRLQEPLRLMGILDEDLDVQVLRALQGKTTVIPVISKADTITTNHMAMLKRAVWDSLKQAKLDPLEALNFNEDEDDSDNFDERDEDAALYEEQLDRNRGHDDLDQDDIIDNLLDRSDGEMDEDQEHPHQLPANPQARPQTHRRSPSGLSTRLSQAAMESSADTPYIPMSIISPDTYEPGVVGRRFPWGFADPFNTEHCDFVRLKDSVFSEWRAELREASREMWYEGWRTSRLNRRTAGSASGAPTGVPNGEPSIPNVQLGNGTQHQRVRNVSGATAKSAGAASSGSLYGGAVGATNGNGTAPGTAYTSNSRMPSGSRSPEMIGGVYRQGVNAF